MSLNCVRVSQIDSKLWDLGNRKSNPFGTMGELILVDKDIISKMI